MNKEEIKIYIPKKTDLDWIDFIIGTKDHPPRDLTKRAFGWVKNKSRALDIGGGALNDTKYLLGKGLRVDVVDVENITLDL